MKKIGNIYKIQKLKLKAKVTLPYLRNLDESKSLYIIVIATDS